MTDVEGKQNTVAFYSGFRMYRVAVPVNIFSTNPMGYTMDLIIVSRQL